MAKFASGKHALGICDRCSWTYKLSELKEEIVRMRPTGMLVCPTCFDQDHPQNMQGMYPVDDPQALRNPRPDTGLEASRGTVTQVDFDDLFIPRSS